MHLQRASRPCWDHLGERAISSLQRYHVEATAVTPDYPSVSDFDRDFLGLSSRSQWSSMLHRTVSSIQVRKQISDRRISRLSLPLAVPYPRRTASFPGPCHSRITALGPAFRVLEYYRARHGAAPRRPPHSHPPSPLSHIPRHCRLSCISIYSTLVLPPRSSSARTFAALVSRVLQNHTCVRPPHSSPVRVLWSSAHIHFFFPLFSEFFMLVCFVCNIGLFIAIFSILENLFMVYYFVVIFMCLDSIPDGINRSGQV